MLRSQWGRYNLPRYMHTFMAPSLRDSTCTRGDTSKSWRQKLGGQSQGTRGIILPVIVAMHNTHETNGTAWNHMSYPGISIWCTCEHRRTMWKSSWVPCKELMFKLDFVFMACSTCLWKISPEDPEVRNQPSYGGNDGNQEKWINLGRRSNIFHQHI